MAGYLDDVHFHGAAHYDRWLNAIDATRRSAARLLNAEPEEIAFVKNTSEGISHFAHGLDWKTGDEVVSVEGEFPANYYPWKVLEARGVRLRLVEQKNGEIPFESIERELTPRARVLTVSFVQFLSGYRLDLNRLGALCESRGVLLFVDAIQGWGGFPVDVRAAKIAGLAACAHKWLLGPVGCAVLFVRRDLADRMEPATMGWMSVKGWEDFASGDLDWRDGAGRFESGSPNVAGIYGLAAALGLLADAGISAISERILDLTARLRRGLKDLGYRIYGPEAPEHSSGIVSFFPREGDANRLTEHLLSHRIVVSSRRGLVRVSPHFYNTEPEMDRLLKLLD